MHLYVVARGIADAINRFENNMLARFLPYKKEGKEYLLQISMRPVRIYEIVFPEEHLENILRLINPSPAGNVEKLVKIMKRMLGLKTVKIPKGMKTDMTVKSDVSVHLIGYRKDKYAKDGTELL